MDARTTTVFLDQEHSELVWLIQKKFIEQAGKAVSVGEVLRRGVKALAKVEQIKKEKAK